MSVGLNFLSNIVIPFIFNIRFWYKHLPQCEDTDIVQWTDCLLISNSLCVSSPNNGCSNLFQGINTVQQLGVRWSTLMSGTPPTPSFALGLEDGFLPWQICCWWHFLLLQGVSRWVHEILTVTKKAAFFSACRSSKFKSARYCWICMSWVYQ